MPKQIVRDVLGELLETGKATAKAGKKAASDVAGQAVKSILGSGNTQKQPSLTKPDESGGLDWLEKMAPQQSQPKVDPQEEDKKRKEQIERMSQIDKKQSRQAYEEIQRQIRMIQQEKASKPRKNITAATGFDEEQVKSPETFFEKMKKKKEEMAKNLPWTSKQGMGTGEIRRGTSG